MTQGPSRKADRALLSALLLAASLALPLAPGASWAQGTAKPPAGSFAAGVQAFEAGDYQTAYQVWLPLAEHGDVAAMRNIGHLYRWGQGVPQDMGQAIAWYRRASEMGFARAQANLAAIYLQGEQGVAVDYAEALKWFEAAAKQGHAVAQYNLGLMYELGLGVEKNEAVALGWYNNAAKAGQPDALERLSLLVMRREAAPSDKPDEAAAKPDQVETSAPPPGLVPTTSKPEPSMPVPAPRVADEPAPRREAKPDAPAAAEKPPAEKPRERRSLLGSFYSAISSGGGVSLPDLFAPGDDEASDTGSSPREKQGRQ